jgi:transposase
MAAGLARFLKRVGIDVFECERPRREERWRGKSDLINAALAARRLLSGERSSLPRGGGRREELRLLLLERRGAVQARNAALNQLSAVLVTAPDHIRARLGALSGDNSLVLPLGCGRAPRSRTASCDGSAVAWSDARGRRQRPSTLSLDLSPRSHRVCRRMRRGSGLRYSAALSSGDPGRMRSEASFAALAGASLVDASSGKQRRHRLNRGGDRQLNWALHVIALQR